MVDVSQVQQYGVITLYLVDPDKIDPIPVPSIDPGVSGGIGDFFAGGPNVKPAFYRFLNPQVQTVPTGAMITVTGRQLWHSHRLRFSALIHQFAGPDTFEDGRQYLTFAWPGSSDPAVGTEISPAVADARLQELMAKAEITISAAL
jgi:hypothetical protein